MMLKTLRQMTEVYERYKPEDQVGDVQIKIGDERFILRLRPQSVGVERGVTEGRVLVEVSMEKETFRRLADGTWNGLTAAGRENMSQWAPIDFDFPCEKKVDALQVAYHLGTHFFRKEFPAMTQFGPEHTRKIHGGNAAALAYGEGIRSAYYTVTGDETINEEGEKDPWYQVFIVIGGRGRARIGNTEVKLREGCAIHVPPQTIHTLRAEGEHRLEVIWLAYGEGA